MIFEVIFDIESKKFFGDEDVSDITDLGASIVSLYARHLNDDFQEVSGEMLSFFEKDFDKMWNYFLKADRIVGYNSLHFDVPVLKPYAPAQFLKLNHFDILAYIKDASGRRVSLNSVAKETIGEIKNDSGENAIKYFAAGDPESLRKLQKYCEMDVELTTKVYDFGRQNKQLKYKDFWNTVRTIDVDFSYPSNFSSSAKQESLF